MSPVHRHAEEGHQCVDRDKRKGNLSRAGEFEHLGPARRRGLHAIGPVAGDGRCRVDGERPLAIVETVGRMRHADRLGRQRGEFVIAAQVVERQQQPAACDLADMRVIDHHQVVAVRHLLDRTVGEGLKRPLLPADRHAGMAGGIGLRRRHHRIEAAAVVPGHAAKMYRVSHCAAPRAGWRRPRRTPPGRGRARSSGARR